MKKLLLLALVALTLFSCGECAKPETETYTKKYTNADFYKEGVFQQDVAKAAYKDMLAFYGVPYTATMEKDMWFADFGLQDFENVGLGGIFWINNAEAGYCGHGIYLLPGQMIPEHKHIKTKHDAKYEAWLMLHGWAYNFSEIGEETVNPPLLPASQKSSIVSKNFVKQEVGQVLELKEVESWHFLLAGDQGAIITEFSTFHDGAGLCFSNPNCTLSSGL